MSNKKYDIYRLHIETNYIQQWIKTKKTFQRHFDIVYCFNNIIW